MKQEKVIHQIIIIISQPYENRPITFDPLYNIMLGL